MNGSIVIVVMGWQLWLWQLDDNMSWSLLSAGIVYSKTSNESVLVLDRYVLVLYNYVYIYIYIHNYIHVYTKYI